MRKHNVCTYENVMIKFIISYANKKTAVLYVFLTSVLPNLLKLLQLPAYEAQRKSRPEPTSACRLKSPR